MDNPARPASPSWFVVRPAVVADYAAFARLHPELKVDDPLPSSEVWASSIAACSLVAETEGQTGEGAEVVGYTYLQEYQDTGYVRMVIVAPHVRGRGVGRALMERVGEKLRGRGIRNWRLNVRPDNHAALALYRRMGLAVQYPSTVLRLPWTALAALPDGHAVTREPAPARDTILEARFDLPRGQLGYARNMGRLVLEAVRGTAPEPIGLAVFSANVGGAFPGAFPFRVIDTGAVAPLLRAMRTLVPEHEFVQVVADDDVRLVALLTTVGATVKDQILHLRGRL